MRVYLLLEVIGRDFLGHGTADPVPAHLNDILVHIVVQKLGLDNAVDLTINLDLVLELYFDHDCFHDRLPVFLSIPRSSAKSWNLAYFCNLKALQEGG